MYRNVKLSFSMNIFEKKDMVKIGKKSEYIKKYTCVKNCVNCDNVFYKP